MTLSPQVRFCGGCGSPVLTALEPMADAEYVGFWDRFGAQVIDLIAISLALTFLGFLLAYVPAAGGLLMAVAILAFLYKNVKVKTPGRKLLGMRVVDRHGQDISFLRGLLRETVGKLVSSFFFLGLIWVAFDGKKQGWHDKIAGTYVIKSMTAKFKLKLASISIGTDRGPVPVEIFGTKGARWHIFPGDSLTGKIIADPDNGEGDATVYFSWNDWGDSGHSSPQTFLVVVAGKGRRSISVKLGR